MMQKAIPPHWYTESDFLQHERQEIFFKEWLFVGHLCEFVSEGAYVTRRIFDQNIFVVRGKGGALRGFYNVCLHRGHELVAGNGVAETIVCPYHNWSYKTDGQLRTATNAKNVEGFDKGQFCLKQVRVEVCGQFVFVNLDAEAKPLADLVGDLAAEISAEYPDVNSAEIQLIDESSWSVKANWKIDVENFLECYHCAPVHSQFCDVFEVRTQRAILKDQYIFHYADAKPAASAGYEFDRTIHPKRLATWTLFPNTIINLLPGEPSINVMVTSPHPTDPSRSVYWAKTYTPTPDAAMLPKLGEIMELTMQEDFAIIESVQRGMQSQGFDNGVLLLDDAESEKSEHTVHHFQQYIRRMMNQSE